MGSTNYISSSLAYYISNNSSGFNAYQIDLSSTNPATINLVNTTRYQSYVFFMLGTSNYSSIGGQINFSTSFYDPSGTKLITLGAFNVYDWTSSQPQSVLPNASISTTNTSTTSNPTKYAYGYRLNWGTGSSSRAVSKVTFTPTQTYGVQKFYILSILGYNPITTITGTVRADNMDNSIVDGIGTGAAAGYISLVGSDNKIIATSSVDKTSGAYSFTNVSYSSTNTSCKLILTTASQTVGSTLTSSTLNGGWADGFTPGTTLLGTQNNAIRSFTRSASDETVDISVHPLPTTESRNVTFSTGDVSTAPTQGGLNPMNVSQTGSYISSSGKMLDLRGAVGFDNNAALTTADGTTSSMRFYLYSAITDGGSLVYNGNTVASTTVYPSTTNPSTDFYKNSLLYYKFSTTGTGKNYSFQYKAIDKFGFISVDPATYSITLTYALPVTYTQELSATISGKAVNLTWTTGNEINNNSFEVQRSTDGNNWSKIGSVPSYFQNGNGNGHAYSFPDEKPYSGMNYYRLKQVDLDGTPHIGNVYKLDYVYSSGNTVAIYPNPVESQLNINNVPSNAATIVIYSMDGKSILTKTVNSSNAQIGVANLPSAVYFVNILDKNGKKLNTLKFEKK